VELRAYRRGELVYENAEAGTVAPSGSLLLRERDFLKDVGVSSDPEEEVTFIAGLHRGSSAFFSQEHHLSYLHRAGGVQAHLLYDQQPLKAAGATAAPVVLMMPKIWIGAHVNTYLLASNAALSPSPKQHSAPVQFSVLDGEGRTVCEWQHTFFYNHAMAFDLRRRIAQHRPLTEAPQFFNLVGRGGSSTFVFFAVIRNTKSNHFAIEHSLPPLYYMDGAMAAVRAQGCDASLFRREAR
jgi:hypothetical protein